MTDYTSREFLTTPQGSDSYEDLDWHNKIKIQALQGLDKLADSINSIANIKAIEFQINNLTSTSEGFAAQMAAKEAEITDLTDQLNVLQQNFDKFKSVLTSIDQMTDEAIS